MSEIEIIERIAAKGDGVTASGRHFSGVAPGDQVDGAGKITFGPHHIDAVCRHFGKCGGCQLQHCDEETLAEFVSSRVSNAAQGKELSFNTLAAADLSPSHSRLRASFRAINGGGGALIGFNQSGSHRMVDLRECHILDPLLFETITKLRPFFSKIRRKFSIGIELVAVDQGIDCLFSGYTPEGLEETERLLDLSREIGLARLSLDQGYGPEPFFEPEPVTISFGSIAVAYPPGSFLQATGHGKAALIAAAQEWLEGSLRVADLFSGLGTFAISLAKGRKIMAAEADRAMVLACKTAAALARLEVDVQHRDLFRNPLRAKELSRCDGIVLDPPRAGARSQVEQIAQSGVEKVVYISCNPSSWSRDSVMLIEAGYELQELRPVGQFRWSTHVELASLFVKRG